MNVPTVENEKAAFEGLLRAVDSIESFRSCARYLERVLPLIFSTLTSSLPDDVHPLVTYQTLALDLAEMFSFTVQFDQLRITKPELPNDFSFYRRLLPKFSKHPDIKIKEDQVAEEAMFTTENMPMMASISKATKNFIGSDTQRRPQVTDLLAVFANSCLGILKTNNSEFYSLAARAMVVSIVLYDHLEEKVFARDSPIKVRECITTLKGTQLPVGESAPLLRIIRYFTLSYSSAPEAIQLLLEDV